VNLSVYLSIYQFEKTEKKAGAGPLSSFFGTKRRTQGLYFPFVFLPFVFESPQSPDPVRTHFSRFVIFYWVRHISNLAATRGSTFLLLLIGLTRKEMKVQFYLMSRD